MISPRYVWDTYAIIAYLHEEPGTIKLKNMLNQAQRNEADILINYVHLGECYYILAREFGEDKANEWVAMIKQWPVIFIPVDERLALLAGTYKARHSMSYADAFAAATAADHRATLVTGDREFRSCESSIVIQWLS